jgi:energy-coupling factor transporter ATP-binding protein EcfA2
MQQHPNPLSPIPSSANALVGKRIKHPRIAEVMSELEALIYPGSQDSTLIVCGPTGAGKTTLARYMVEAAVERAAIDMEQNAGTIPAIFVEAPGGCSISKFSLSWATTWTHRKLPMASTYIRDAWSGHAALAAIASRRCGRPLNADWKSGTSNFSLLTKLRTSFTRRETVTSLKFTSTH